ncbi:MAG: hypothetical protein V1747_09945 [Candidatus Omnitrophota bacterium]
MSKKIILTLINSVLILLLFGIYAFAKNQIVLDVLSPKLNLEKISFEKYMLKDRVKLLATLKVYTQEIENPYQVLGRVTHRIMMNDENLIIREQVKKDGMTREVHNSLLRILDDGTEQLLGQCWYKINRNDAILAGDASNMRLPAFKIKEEGKGYGTVLFAAVLESARNYDVTSFTVNIALTSIYERFGFREVEYGILDELYRIINPEDPSFFNTAIDLAKERGITVSFTLQELPFSEKPVFARSIIGLEKPFAQSI